MSVAKVREYLRAKGLRSTLANFPSPAPLVEQVALAVGVEPARIAKTLSFLVGEKPVPIVCAGDTRIDNPRYKAQFHTKAKMIPFEQAEQLVGHAPGGVCPFAIEPGVQTWQGVSLQHFETIYPATGSDASAVRLIPAELEFVAQNFTGWIDVCKGWREGE